jgi:hypothetical protein
LSEHTLRTTINQWLQGLEVILIHHSHERSIDPSTSFHTVEPADHHLELHVVILILVLDLAVERRYFDSFDSLLTKLAATSAFDFPTSA